MVKLTVLYAKPADTEAFDAYYLSTHIPLVDKAPGVLRSEVSKVTGMLDGSTPPYYLQAELYFADADSMMATFASPEGQAMAADMANFVTSEVTTMMSDVLKEN